MSRSENPRNPFGARGRGTGEGPNSYLAEFNTEANEEGFVLNRGKGEIGLAPVPRPLSRSGLPGCGARDLKGKDTALFDKTYVKPGEKPWHELSRSHVRHAATTYPAVLLSKAERQAAARDVGLIWDEDTRTYKPRPKAPPPPRAAKVAHAEGEAS